MISTGDHREQIQIGESVCLSVCLTDWLSNYLCVCVCLFVFLYLLSICTALYMTAYIQSTFSKYLFESIKEFEFK